MQKLMTALYRSWTKQLLLVAATVVLICLTYLCLLALSQVTPGTSHLHDEISLILFAFLAPIGLAWFGYRMTSISIFLPTASAISVLTASVSQSFSFLFFIPIHALFCFLLFFLDERKDASVIDCNVEIEKAINEKNDLELSYREKGTSISVLFEKYTSYYNLRNLATDFSATLAVRDLCQTVVQRTVELIQKGTQCHLLLSEPEAGTLSLMAFKSTGGQRTVKEKGGDLFDFWILRNRQSLIVQDTQRDFRFDLKQTQAMKHIRSLISSPIVHEGKAVGTLRLHSDQPSAFATDDLRILDAISTLASSAASNALLFYKTEELAIRDSVTGLYVQRYFRERLLEEHRRSLLTNAPLTLLMCDLDRFKSYNDRYGHAVGDLILKKSATLIKKTAKDGFVARYGGEEFAVLAPKHDLEAGHKLAETVREAIASMELSVRREVIPLTISIGVAAFPLDTLDSEELIHIADKRLYRAKEAGRNQVCSGE